MHTNTHARTAMQLNHSSRLSRAHAGSLKQTRLFFILLTLSLSGRTRSGDSANGTRPHNNTASPSWTAVFLSGLSSHYTGIAVSRSCAADINARAAAAVAGCLFFAGQPVAPPFLRDGRQR